MFGRRRTVPFVFSPRHQTIDERSEDRTENQGPKESIGAVEPELDVGRSGRDKYREQDSSQPRIGRRLRVGDHVEREQQEGTALQLLKRYGPRIAEPERAAKQDTDVGEQESVGHVASRRAINDHAARAGDEKREV